MTKYYFLGSLLPELSVGKEPEIGFWEYEQLLTENLTDSDLAKVVTIRNLYDILNIRLFWKSQPLDPMGNYNAKELEEAFATQSMLPAYVFKFMEKYDSVDERLRHFPELISTFFSEETRHGTGFFKEYLVMERELRLILAAFRAKKLNRDISLELQFEHPDDPIVAQILAQKDSPQYEPPEEYQELKSLFNQYGERPLELQKALFEFRLNKIEEKVGQDLFSTNRILAYLAELILIERWRQMDRQKGLEIVDRMLKEIP